MDSGVAPHFRGAGPIFLRPVIRNPVRVVRWSAWLASEAAAPSVCSASQAAPTDLGMRFILFWCDARGQGRAEDEARESVARARAASAERAVMGRQRLQ
jgi:hypothetical protein